MNLQANSADIHGPDRGTPTVSVIMPAYNSEAYIEEAALSVLGQTYRDLELIVVDDGSKDGTLSVVQALARSDSRLTVLAQPNSGRPSIARNRGLERARGRYLAFLDSDDLWFPDRVERMVAGLDRHPHWVAVFHDLKLIAADGSDLGQTYLADADFLERAKPWIKPCDEAWWECDARFFVFMSLQYAAVHTQSVMIARERLADSRVDFDSGFVVCEDIDLWIRVAMQGSMGYLDQILSAYRQHPTSVTRDPYRYVSESVRFHEHNRLRLDPLLGREDRFLYAKKVASYLRDLGYAAYSRQDMAKAREAYLRALRLAGVAGDCLALAKTALPGWIRGRK
ncbi:MAG: glycosyltransferase [Dechloromonas sp.]|jgi:glycosyltransferase involved in cell wall biosynthesis|nr:glycosyltransferase [Dechloromonas sp.]